MNLLVDASVWLGLFNKDDSLHRKANDVLKDIADDYTLWVTEHVVDEIANIMIKRGFARELKQFTRRIKKEELKLFVPESASESIEIFEKTFKIVFQSKNVKPSYTDLHQIVVAQQGYLPQAHVLSFDKHFEHFADVWFDYESLF